MSEHDYAAAPIEESAMANNTKRDRTMGTPANTPEKTHMEKKTKGMSQQEKNTETILKAIDALGKWVNGRIEDLTMQLKQHSAMEEGIWFAKDLTQEDWRARQALWPKIEKPRKAKWLGS